ncbi:MAG: phosphoribosylformylglycinamidine synthase I [Planctomycetia bacterium]|nr:phosphoribosylformylglycinamidine synthase I [Planctomycetia bacterium]
MAQPRALILRAPGTNCDVETAHAFGRAGAAPQTLHVNRALENPRLFDEYQIFCVPGGFSYGDDIAAGRIFGNQIRHHLAERLHAFREQGKLILGICNGFQVLAKSGVLFDDADVRAGSRPPATLAWNASGKFEDRWVRLVVEGSRCVFFRGIESMYLPVAHAEGQFIARDRETLASLAARGQIALRYAAMDDARQPTDRYPDNPNGSMAAVAGVCDATGRVCGLMPHPERHIDRTQHPRWTRGEGTDEGEGLRVFKNAVEYFR